MNKNSVWDESTLSPILYVSHFCPVRYSQTASSTPYLMYESSDAEVLAASVQGLSRQSSSGYYDQNSRAATDTPSNYSDEDDDSESDRSSTVDMG